MEERVKKLEIKLCTLQAHFELLEVNRESVLKDNRLMIKTIFNQLDLISYLTKENDNLKKAIKN